MEGIRKGAAAPEDVTTRRQFDRIAPAYDATRDPLEPATLAGLLESGPRGPGARWLEVGVGTGRVAAALAGAGVAVVGLDASSGMLVRARAKGLRRLVRGSAHALPFPAATFDIVLFVHVLHVPPRPEAMLREAARVCRGELRAIVTRRELLDPGAPDDGSPGSRDAFRRAFERAGLPPPRWRGPWEREEAILRAHPPDLRRPLAERVVTETAERRLERMERRADRATLHVADADLQRIVAELRRELANRRYTYRRTTYLVAWDAARLARHLGPTAPPDAAGTRGPKAP